MNYHHLTIEERCCIREFYKKGKSYREIAGLVGRNVSTIYRELNRNFTHMYDIPTYYPHTAHKKYLFRRSFCHRGMFWKKDVIDYINEKLLLTWSPEQIANTPSFSDNLIHKIYKKRRQQIQELLKKLRKNGIITLQRNKINILPATVVACALLSANRCFR